MSKASSAIFGFTGPPDEELLSQMGHSLAHRGTATSLMSSSKISVGIRGHDFGNADTAGRPEAGESLSGTCASTEGVIALVGYQTAGEIGRKISLRDIASSLFSLHTVPRELSGDFVIAAMSEEGELFLVRDGSGGRSIYFAWHDGRYLFASEPKAMWSVPGFARQLNEKTVAQYLTFSFVPNEPTMLKGIFDLPAGHLMYCQSAVAGNGSQGRQKRESYRGRRDNLRKIDGVGQAPSHVLYRYFQFENQDSNGFVADCKTDRSQWANQLRQCLGSTIDEQVELLRQRPVVFLSGGLDSSIVAAEVVGRSSQKVKTFAMHFGKQYPNELVYAGEVAAHLGTQHHEVQVDPKSFLGDMRKMIWHLDDPIGDPITMPNFQLAKHVSNETDFVFNGEGGDPCFGGPKNLSMLLGHWYGGRRPEMFRELAYLESYRRAYEEIDLIFSKPFGRYVSRDALAKILTPFFECEKSELFLNKLMAINIRLKGAHLILPKVERMLGAHGVTPLSPLFSDHIVNFSYRLPTCMKLHRGIEKVVLKEAYRDQLPMSVISRPKSGMRVPVHFWFQGELKKYARHILRPRAIRRAGIFDPARVKQLVDYNVEERSGRYGMRLWMLLTFEIWRRIVVEGESV